MSIWKSPVPLKLNVPKLAKIELLNSRIVDVDAPTKLTFAEVTVEFIVKPLLVVRLTPEFTVMVLLPVKFMVFTVVLPVTVGARVVLPGITTSSVLVGVPDGVQLFAVLQVVLDDPFHT